MPTCHRCRWPTACRRRGPCRATARASTKRCWSSRCTGCGRCGSRYPRRAATSCSSWWIWWTTNMTAIRHADHGHDYAVTTGANDAQSHANLGGDSDERCKHVAIRGGASARAANHVPLTPVSFLRRAALIHPERIAVIHGDWHLTYREFQQRVWRLANALRPAASRGDTVSAMLPNVPAMLELHYAVPMLGAVLNTINTRLDAGTVAYIFDHGETKAVFTDREFSGVIKDALGPVQRKPMVIDIDDKLYEGGELIGETDYESFIAASPADDPGDRGPTSGRRSRSTTPPAPPAGPRASSIPTAAPIWRRWATSCPGRCRASRSICGRCRCSTATAGASAGRWWRCRHPCVSAQDRSGADLPADREAPGHPYVRRAHGAQHAVQRAR
jgi:hypothetical protein